MIGTSASSSARLRRPQPLRARAPTSRRRLLELHDQVLDHRHLQPGWPAKPNAFRPDLPERRAARSRPRASTAAWRRRHRPVAHVDGERILVAADSR